MLDHGLDFLKAPAPTVNPNLSFCLSRGAHPSHPDEPFLRSLGQREPINGEDLHACEKVTALGKGTLLVTASGVFGQMQSALNLIWKAEPKAGLSGLVKARIASLFAAIYKVLHDKQTAWRDVVIGALVTSLLFTIGKSLIGFYIGHSDIGSSYGGAGAFVIVLLWIYYSSQIFLLGAEFTHVYAQTHASESARSPSNQGLETEVPYRCFRPMNEWQAPQDTPEQCRAEARRVRSLIPIARTAAVATIERLAEELDRQADKMETQNDAAASDIISSH